MPTQWYIEQSRNDQVRTEVISQKFGRRWGGRVARDGLSKASRRLRR